LQNWGDITGSEKVVKKNPGAKSKLRNVGEVLGKRTNYWERSRTPGIKKFPSTNEKCGAQIAVTPAEVVRGGVRIIETHKTQQQKGKEGKEKKEESGTLQPGGGGPIGETRRSFCEERGRGAWPKSALRANRKS